MVKDRQQPVLRYAPAGVPNSRLNLARARTSIIESSFGCLTKDLVMNQTLYALRHLRRLARYALSRPVRLHVTVQR